LECHGIIQLHLRYTALDVFSVESIRCEQHDQNESIEILSQSLAEDFFTGVHDVLQVFKRRYRSLKMHIDSFHQRSSIGHASRGSELFDLIQQLDVLSQTNEAVH
jgi:hypothetical protein